MASIFISHSSEDVDFATRFMDLLQTQFGLTRDDFFMTSDEEFEAGENWINVIRNAVEESVIILPILTPNFLDSQFCLCELGASWVSQKALFPIIVPPLDHRALDGTPYRSWSQSIVLQDERNFMQVAEQMKKKISKDFNSVRYQSRVKSFIDETLKPFVRLMEGREVISKEAVLELKAKIQEYDGAYFEIESELRELRKENSALREMKDSSEVQAYDYSQMSEWDAFIEKVKNVKEELRKLSILATSVLYHDYSKGSSTDTGYMRREEQGELKELESKGLIVWDEGWVPDYDHNVMIRARNSLKELDSLIKENFSNENFVDRFDQEYNDVRLSLFYSPFWEEVLGETIYHSTW
ncbi:toll/interleukin-1 receptor domain-containing protein [Halobacillus halophilus]|uniref:toll/interleukin-1 receptor domain-containing protein n=1 Tax=Halobacillus halophilus TaxID=1570 RepID=UPI001CD7FBA7|nr:toll/interleukin-1 receptor domain-containing protein [Halobacillus halophilus]MCA1011396.1 toll/interleukin-1 receptor domain-containing protein [Halobacillus halophilus]